MSCGLHVKYPFFFSKLNETNYLDSFSKKNTQLSNSWKTVQWEPSGSMWTEERMDEHEANSRLSQFAKEPKNKSIKLL